MLSMAFHLDLINWADYSGFVTVGKHPNKWPDGNYLPLEMCCSLLILSLEINSASPGQNGRHFVDFIFRCIFMNEQFLYFD